MSRPGTSQSLRTSLPMSMHDGDASTSGLGFGVHGASMGLGTRAMSASAAGSLRRSTGYVRPMDFVGTDTFRGTNASSTASRMSLYSKNGGEVGLDNTCNVLRVESPITGDLLVTPLARNRAGVRDPVSGTPMRYHGEMAVLQTPGAGNQLQRHRKFYITKDVDITIQTLRNTTKVSKYTNEKVGTAGTPTGIDPALQFYQSSR
ncbi:hypothetical protein CHLRE_17g732150v5 [Chlamydomonas reinhardtii]|uniref:Uncharacterized protein n=1 Tax=Chlamydomonas reinhardtii TaxID=3055 RepID=A8JFD9_CHLRE|nr:uncharacterized protein CHLRE_17g732150v5 [Chlamydomonas reinhardtii]PNW70729.1 hypothetical protein CHLRE_17g732150v5 [Chlamydomonas reinhardtii]|eukprot:XP_001701529.1 flagellar associated protein, minor isoform [Chlamydomonas reinhardtii]